MRYLHLLAEKLAFLGTILPSVRLAIYFGLGTVLWAVGALEPGFLVGAMVYDGMLLFAALIDLILSPQPHEIETERELHEKMNLGTPNPVTLHLRNVAGQTRRVTIRDEVPEGWEVSLVEGTAPPPATPEGDLTEVEPRVARVEVVLEPGAVAAVQYLVTPTRRGDFAFGAITVRYPTVLGLWYRQSRRPAAQNVRVYPDNTQVKRFELRLRQGRLRDIGLHLLRLRGRGTEFESLRDYTTDDEYKDINWKASARMGKLISTNYEIERDQTVMVTVDCGRMMTALAITRDAAEQRPTGKGRRLEGNSPLDNTMEPPPLVPLSKLDCAINATVLVAHVAASMGDAVGLLLFADGVLKFLPPRKGRQQTGLIIDALYAAQPSLVEPDYNAAYEFLLARKVRRGLVITFTDLIDPASSHELLTASATLRRHHNPLCVTINNRDVMELARVMPEDTRALYEKAMAQRMLTQRGNALEELRRRGVGILDVPAEQLTIATVNRYLELKSRAAL